MPTLDFCNGFLEAMALLNAELTDVYSAFEISRLPEAPNLRAALDLHFENQGKVLYSPPREYPASAWHIELDEIDGLDGKVMRKICEQWFFCSTCMTAAPQSHHYRSNVVGAFLGALSSAFKDYIPHTVLTRPPIWYAEEWNDIAFEKGHERYLMHMSRSN